MQMYTRDRTIVAHQLHGALDGTSFDSIRFRQHTDGTMAPRSSMVKKELAPILQCFMKKEQAENEMQALAVA